MEQLATYARKHTKPSLTPLDRAFWVALSRLWPRWRDTLVIVKPDTVVRWHRKGFRLYGDGPGCNLPTPERFLAEARIYFSHSNSK